MNLTSRPMVEANWSSTARPSRARPREGRASLLCTEDSFPCSFTVLVWRARPMVSDMGSTETTSSYQARVPRQPDITCLGFTDTSESTLQGPSGNRPRISSNASALSARGDHQPRSATTSSCVTRCVFGRTRLTAGLTCQRPRYLHGYAGTSKRFLPRCLALCCRERL